jgi:predicted permease
MIESFYASSGMPIGLIIDQLGTYLVLSTIGILTICHYSEAAVSPRELAKRIATFPPLITLVLAAALMPFSYPAWVVSVLSRLSGTLAPLVLVSVGLQLRLDALRGNRGLFSL